jgi:putative ABC transport system substrate-binding protein
MLRGMLPNVAHVALLVNPSNSVNVALHKVIESAASKSGIKLQPVRASTAQGLAEGFLEIARQKAGALIVPREAFFLQQKAQIVSLIARQRLPSISASSDFVEAGCLMSYGNDIRDNYRRAAVYVDKIIKGAKPGDLPVEQPTKFELFVNAKTAKVLGIKVPPSLLMQATKVID